MAKMSTKFDWCKHLINDTSKQHCIVIHFCHYSAVVLIQNKPTLIADVYENYRFQKLYEPLICKSTSKREKKDAKLAALDIFQCDQSCQLCFRLAIATCHTCVSCQPLGKCFQHIKRRSIYICHTRNKLHYFEQYMFLFSYYIKFFVRNITLKNFASVNICDT